MWNKLCIGQDVIGGMTKWGLFWRGIIAVLLGCVFAFKPVLTTINLGFLVGWIFTFSGIWIMISAFTRSEKRASWFLYGFLLTAAGALLLYNPAAEILFLAWTIAAFFLTGGVIGLSISCAFKGQCVNKIFNIISAVISILIGILLFFWPMMGLVELIWVIGILLIAEGILLVVFSFFTPKLPPPEAPEGAKPE